jgi:hypothetical protein
LPQRLRRPPLLDLNQLLPAGYVPSCNKLFSRGAFTVAKARRKSWNV